MSTIPPGRLNDVSDAADFVTLTQDNFEILSQELFKATPTYQNGAPNTVIGPPTSGDRVLGEVWRDSLGAVFVCTAAGSPGTWKQVAPAPVEADPTTGTIPAGYQIRNTAEHGVEKWHAGSYLWIRKHGHSHAVVGGADVPWGSFSPGAAWATVNLIAAALSFDLQPGTYLLLAVLRLDPIDTDTFYLRMRDTTAGADIIPESTYVIPDQMSVTLSAVATLAQTSTVEVQAKQADDCSVRSNGTSFVAVRLY